MVAALKITVDDRAFRAALDHLQRAARDMEPAMRDIAATLWERAGERFETQRDPVGRGWEPKKGESAPATLVVSQHMLNSLKPHADATRAEVGFGQPYAIYHEFGTAKMPRRGIFYLDPEAGQLSAEDEALILGRIAEHLRRAG
ncbi:MAG: phage virion morphogenesis protein [Azoarcus sp.]|jgi:phage virion morphogenesis protein|nr:phage virion morphogenesis protein [Azoarcus sp.]